MTTAIATLESVAHLRSQVEQLHLQEEHDALASQIRIRQEVENLVEDWGDFVDPFDALRSEPDLFGGYAVNASRPDRPDDRRNGDFAPHFRNETELARICGACEFLADTDVTVIGAFETLSAFVLKQGSTYEITANEPEGEPYTEQIKAVLDEFTTRVNWYGGVDKESFNRAHKVGTRFLRVTDVGDGYAGIEFYERSWITEPLNREEIADHYGLPAGLDWKYGVVTDPDNVNLVWGYYAAKYGDPKCGEFICAEEMDRLKVNTDSNVKLGIPDIYAGRKWVVKFDKLFERTMDGTAIQASIALRRTYPDTMRSSQVGSAADAQVTFRGTRPAMGGGTELVKAQRFDSGTIVDQKGVNYEAGPLGQGQAEMYVAVAEAALRIFSRRWGITEDAISGNAENNTLASLAEAGSTSLMRMQAAQTVIATNDVGVFWKVIRRAVDGGRIVGIAFERLKQIITLKVMPPDIEHRDQVDQHTIRSGEHAAGMLSKETWATETGRDYNKEQAKRAQEPQNQPAMLGPDGQPLINASGQPMPAQQQSNLPESRVESLAARCLRLLESDLQESDEEGGHWVTINGEHMLIGGNGVVQSGSLKGKHISGAAGKMSDKANASSRASKTGEDHASSAEAHNAAAMAHIASAQNTSDKALAREHLAAAQQHLNVAKDHTDIAEKSISHEKGN